MAANQIKLSKKSAWRSSGWASAPSSFRSTRTIPHAEMYAICQRSQEKLNQIGDAFGVGVRYTKFEDVLADPNVDAIHINTPIPDHAAAEPGRAEGRQARGLHRADGHHASTSARRSSRPSAPAARTT